MSLLGIDIGSSGCKGAAFGYDGQILAQAGREYSSCYVSSGFVEIDAELFWDAAVNVIREISDKTANDPIEALAISSHGETVIPVDENGNAIAPAIMNSDNRAVAQALKIEKELGREKIYEITGLPCHPMFPINKICWLIENKPQLYEKAYKFLSVEDYILVKMGLPCYTDYSIASRVMALDIKKKKWSDEILSYCGVHQQKLPDLMPSGQIVGRLSTDIARILNLKQGVVVAMGGHDQPCGALGAGNIEHGNMTDSAGTYECLAVTSDKANNTADALRYSLNSYCHVVAGKYITLAFFPAGLVSKWFSDQFCFEDRYNAEKKNLSMFELMDNIVTTQIKEPTGLCVTPHFIGSCNPYWDVRATGAIVGLTPDISRYHLYKAIYEGIGCELAVNINALEEIFGAFSSVRISGRNARSEFTVQLRADVTNKTFEIANTSETVCQGAAILAGIAAGIYKDCKDAAQKAVNISKIIKPDQQTASKYKAQLEKYKKFYDSLKAIRET